MITQISIEQFNELQKALEFQRQYAVIQGYPTDDIPKVVSQRYFSSGISDIPPFDVDVIDMVEFEINTDDCNLLFHLAIKI